MNVFETILNRRTIKDFKPDPVPEELLDRALTAGLWAQNHNLTQPWSFIVLGPKSRSALADLYADLQLPPVKPGLQDARRKKAIVEAKQKILSKPVIVAITYRMEGNRQQLMEDFAATCCAIQNIQLAAWSGGLGMQWSTSSLIHDERIHELLKTDPGREDIVGLLFFGYPARIPEPGIRKSLAEVKRRLD